MSPLRPSVRRSAKTSEANATPTSVRADAGSRRRMRRAQNRPSEMRPLALRSPSSSDVMRNPDNVKNVDTPR